MNIQTKNAGGIEWCDYTWNPVTGCLHGCEYCYAAKIYKRFKKSFEPTLHIERLDELKKLKKPSIIFVCSTSDLFGDFIPDEWILKVFLACEKYPQHKYLFLTKNPKRYEKVLPDQYLPQNWWFGCTVTHPEMATTFKLHHSANTFISIEPILSGFQGIYGFDWIIIGQQTGTGAVKPKPEWVSSIIDYANIDNVPIFVKNPLFQQFQIQKWPKGLKEDL